MLSVAQATRSQTVHLERRRGARTDGLAVGLEPAPGAEERRDHRCREPAIPCRPKVDLEVAGFRDGADEEVDEAGGVCGSAARVSIGLRHRLRHRAASSTNGPGQSRRCHVNVSQIAGRCAVSHQW
eukprot:COSAG04_NODE_8542_length_960_cov_1.085947_1_plen_125_part_10